MRPNKSSADELQPEIAELVGVLKRELLNNIARTLLFAGTPREATKPQPYPVERKLSDANQSINLYEELRQYEIDLIHWALRQARGKQKLAARLLGIKPTTLNNKIKQYDIAWKDKATASPKS
ncbi:MAG TPA: helix-turn-helix domain-containing protein [Pyrinomonadaceae bacterium]|nr:helix-turn-helix domain-containing protein [Pyrinomonadaceae bacterium]